MFTRGRCCAGSSPTPTVRTSSLISECNLPSYDSWNSRPVRHRSVYYNCRVIVYNKFIYLIRPKLWLANDGNYRERRYFQCWEKPRHVDKYDIPMTVCPLLASGQVPLYTSNTNFSRNNVPLAMRWSELETPSLDLKPVRNCGLRNLLMRIWALTAVRSLQTPAVHTTSFANYPIGSTWFKPQHILEGGFTSTPTNKVVMEIDSIMTVQPWLHQMVKFLDKAHNSPYRTWYVYFVYYWLRN